MQKTHPIIGLHCWFSSSVILDFSSYPPFSLHVSSALAVRRQDLPAGCDFDWTLHAGGLSPL